MVKVVKFGGSSLASAEQFAKVGNIIRSDESRKFVVPSAPGKRNSKDTKVTDMLYDCYAMAAADEEFRIPLMKIKDRYDSIINGLNLKLSLEEEFKKDYFIKLINDVRKEYKTKVIFPRKDQVFNAFRYTPYHREKSHQPYPNPLGLDSPIFQFCYYDGCEDYSEYFLPF